MNRFSLDFFLVSQGNGPAAGKVKSGSKKDSKGVSGGGSVNIHDSEEVISRIEGLMTELTRMMDILEADQQHANEAALSAQNQHRGGTKPSASKHGGHREQPQYEEAQARTSSAKAGKGHK
jgi:hypothetical protein